MVILLPVVAIGCGLGILGTGDATIDVEPGFPTDSAIALPLPKIKSAWTNGQNDVFDTGAGKTWTCAEVNSWLRAMWT